VRLALLLSLLLAVLGGPALAAAEAAQVQVYKTPTCGCCTKWIEHLERAGFAVTATDLPDLAAVKREHGVPAHLASCHTALVEGYVVEGHVPAADLQRLLRERPDARGLAVPGMPHGSPGMEGPRPPEPYDVLLFGADGATRVFSRHGAP